MTRRNRRETKTTAEINEEKAEEIAEDTAAVELEKLQRKVAREERKKRREIEEKSQKKAIWLLPALLLLTMTLAFVFSNLNFAVN